jgi:hypothetical protein
MFACMAQVILLQYMLVWCMLVIGLNDEMKTSIYRIARYLNYLWY